MLPFTGLNLTWAVVAGLRPADGSRRTLADRPRRPATQCARPSRPSSLSAGTAGLAWVGITLAWGEPVTAGHRCARPSRALGTSSRVTHRRPPLDERQQRSDAACSPRPGARPDRRAGLGLRRVFVEGTRAGDLARVPGHYRITALPGFGGHGRDRGPSDDVLAAFPAPRPAPAGRQHRSSSCRTATFRYEVYARRIVDDRDWSILRKRPFEKLVLTACHPLYSAAQRIVVFARLQHRSTETPRSDSSRARRVHPPVGFLVRVEPHDGFDLREARGARLGAHVPGSTRPLSPPRSADADLADHQRLPARVVPRRAAQRSSLRDCHRLHERVDPQL